MRLLKTNNEGVGTHMYKWMYGVWHKGGTPQSGKTIQEKLQKSGDLHIIIPEW